MKSRFCFIDPGVIMGVVIALVILAIGVFATFVTLQQVRTQVGYSDGGTAGSAVNNTTATANSVFNIVGVVLIIGAIMAIVGLVYGYVR